MSITIIFHCGEIYHIESSTDFNYINDLKQDYNNKLAYIVCDNIGLIIQKFGYEECINDCIRMISVLQQKNGTCIVYKTHTAYYDSNGDKIVR